MNLSANQYLKNQIETASPEQILLMLYDGAVRFIRRAISGMENNDRAEIRIGVNRTLAIITEFSSSLDHKIGGKIAEDLDALYAFMIRELNAVTVSPDMGKLQGVEKLLVDLRETWREAVDINRQEQNAHVMAARGASAQGGAYQQSQMAMTGTYGAGAASIPQGYTPISVSR